MKFILSIVIALTAGCASTPRACVGVLAIEDANGPSHRAAPCDPKVDTEINGRCWVRILHDLPCPRHSLSANGGCYLPTSTPDVGLCPSGP